MTLSLIPEVFNAINVISLICEKLGVIDSHVAEIAHVESIVGLERIGIDDTVGLDLLLYDRQESSCSGVWNDGRLDLPAPLEQAEDRNLACGSSTSLALATASEVALVRLDFSTELVAGKLAGDQLSQSHEEADRSVGLDASHFRSGPSCRARNEELDELALFARRQPTLSTIHVKQHTPYWLS
jgi:hypothetical protein